jgi:hypothetical protein
MHISVKDQTKDQKPAIMCVEREIRTCIILNADIDKVETLATLAEAIGVTEILILAKPNDVDALYEQGWEPSCPPTCVLLVKKLKGNKR